MKKSLIVSVFIFISVFSFSARTYQVDRQELIHLSYVAAEHIFPEDVEGWKDVLIGTLAVETNLGQFRGNSIYGVAQMRNSGFQFVQRELKKNRTEREIFERLTGRDPSTVSLQMLGNDHQLSIVYMAFYYKFYVHGKIRPENKEMAAKIWKQYYNTKYGTGSPQRFLTIYAKQQKYIEQYKKSRGIHENTFVNTETEIVDIIKEIEDLESLENLENKDNAEMKIETTETEQK